MARPAPYTETRTVPGLRLARGVRVTITAEQHYILRHSLGLGRRAGGYQGTDLYSEDLW